MHPKITNCNLYIHFSVIPYVDQRVLKVGALPLPRTIFQAERFVNRFNYILVKKLLRLKTSYARTFLIFMFLLLRVANVIVLF